VLWTFPTANFLSGAIVTGGVVYLPNQPQNTVVQHIHALRASDGSQLWDTALPQACGYVGGEAADQGMVFVSCGIQLVGQNCCGYIGSNIVYGLRARDGRVLWHSSSSYVAPPGVLDVDAAGGGLVYVRVGGQNAAGANVSGLVALDETTGAVRWQVATAGAGRPVFDGTTLYADIASSSAPIPLRPNLEAFSASDGKRLWTYSMGTQLIGHGLLGPVIAGGVVYTGLNGQVMAISAANGTQLWRTPPLDAGVGVLGLTVVTGG
jgi:outer membrane protein assembly factor BamB